MLHALLGCRGSKATTSHDSLYIHSPLMISPTFARRLLARPFAALTPHSIDDCRRSFAGLFAMTPNASLMRRAADQALLRDYRRIDAGVYPASYDLRFPRLPGGRQQYDVGALQRFQYATLLAGGFWRHDDYAGCCFDCADRCGRQT